MTEKIRKKAIKKIEKLNSKILKVEEKLDELTTTRQCLQEWVGLNDNWIGGSILYPEK